MKKKTIILVILVTNCMSIILCILIENFFKKSTISITGAATNYSKDVSIPEQAPKGLDEKRTIENINLPQISEDNLEIPLTKLNTKIIYYFDNHGGKQNDESYDNSSHLLKLINKIGDKGGTIVFGEGTYEFKKAIKIDSRVCGIKFYGIAMGEKGNRTLLNWTGKGYLFSFKGGLWWCNFESLRIMCHNNNAFNISGLMFKSRMKDVAIKNSVIGVNVGSFAYAFFENLTIHTTNKKAEYGVIIGESYNETREFLYIENSSIDGANLANGDGIYIKSGSSIYILKTDICNWGKGRAIYVEREKDAPMLSLLYLQYVNVIRCDGGIHFNAKNLIESVFIDKVAIIFRGDHKNERGLYFESSTKDVVIQVSVSDYHTRKIGSVTPEYVVYSKGFCIQPSSRIHISLNLAKGKICIGNKYTKAIVIYDGIDYEKRFSFIGDGINKSFECELTLESPFTNSPVVSINTNLTLPFSVSVSNTNGKKLLATVTFNEAPVGTFELYTQISQGGSN